MLEIGRLSTVQKAINRFHYRPILAIKKECYYRDEFVNCMNNDWITLSTQVFFDTGVRPEELTRIIGEIV